jgi:mRNA interferase MazF
MGSEVNKTWPCVAISPDEMNKYLNTIIIAPLSTTLKAYPTRVLCEINGEKGSIMLDQIRTVDKRRIGQLLGKLTTDEVSAIKNTINQMLC